MKMTNKERKAIWLEAAKFARHAFGDYTETVIINEANRRFPTIKTTKPFEQDGTRYRCVERGGRRVLQYNSSGLRWCDSYTYTNDAVIAAVRAPFDQEEDA